MNTTDIFLKDVAHVPPYETDVEPVEVECHRHGMFQKNQHTDASTWVVLVSAASHIEPCKPSGNDGKNRPILLRHRQ